MTPNATGGFTATTVVSDDIQFSGISADTYRGRWIMRRDAATAADRVRRANIYTPASGTLTQDGENYADTTVGTELAELWANALRPDTDLRQILTVALRRAKYIDYQPLSLLSDGHMDNTDASAYTASSVNVTLSKVTTAARVHWGVRALRVLNAAAGEYAFQRINVRAGEVYWCVALCNADVGTARLRAFDVTGSATIATIDAPTGQVDIPLVLTLTPINIPSGSTQLEIRLIGTGASDDVYWSFCQLFKIGDRRMSLPNSGANQVFEGRWITGLRRLVGGGANLATGGNGSVVLLEEMRPQDLTRFDPAVYRNWTNVAHLQLDEALGSGYPYFLELYRPYVDDNNEPAATSVGDAVVYNVPLDYIVPLAKEAIAEMIFARTALGQKLAALTISEDTLKLWKAEAKAARLTYEPAMRRRGSKDTWGAGTPW